MKVKLFKNMAKQKLYTVSLLWLFCCLLWQCGSDSNDLPLPINQQTDGPINSESSHKKDSSTELQLIGKWELTHVNGASVKSDSDLAGNYQAFLSDRSWIWIRELPYKDTSIAVEGAAWTYDGNTKQINLTFTDSVTRIMYLSELKGNRMILEKLDNTTQTWRRSGKLEELPPTSNSSK